MGITLPPPSPVNSQQDIYRPTYTRHLWRQEFRCCQSARVYRSAISVTTGYQLRTIQTKTEKHFSSGL